jgi:Flp pilus assembly protein TadD
MGRESRSSVDEEVRAAVADAKPPTRPPIETVESSSQELTAALRLVRSSPTAEGNRRVAAAYRTAGILDTAYEHFSEAVRLDPQDGWAYDGMAQIWRDWGFPGLGLGHAYRAVCRLPNVPGPLNTLGTILFALGQVHEARMRFEQVLRLSPNAGYALNNLCYAALMDGDLDEARAVCRRAMEVAPDLSAARNNLALVYVAGGDLDGAARLFAASPDPAERQYNLGLVFLVSGRYREAAAALDAAARLKPTLPFVNERARQARELAGGTDARH